MQTIHSLGLFLFSFPSEVCHYSPVEWGSGVMRERPGHTRSDFTVGGGWACWDPTNKDLPHQKKKKKKENWEFKVSLCWLCPKFKDSLCT